MAISSNRPKEIFLQALDIASSGERAAYLAQACDGDEAMRRQIDAMLQAHGQPDSFLEKPAAMGLTVDASDALPMANHLHDAQGARRNSFSLVKLWPGFTRKTEFKLHLATVTPKGKAAEFLDNVIVDSKSHGRNGASR